MSLEFPVDALELPCEYRSLRPCTHCGGRPTRKFSDELGYICRKCDDALTDELRRRWKNTLGPRLKRRHDSPYPLKDTKAPEPPVGPRPKVRL